MIVREYQIEFEKLANHTKGLKDAFFCSCLINGLKEEIQTEVKMFNPNNITTIIALANLVEDKFNTQRKNTKPSVWKPPSL